MTTHPTMTSNTLREDLIKLFSENGFINVELATETPKIILDLELLISKECDRADRGARIDELSLWFDMPKHYQGEEYLDEPFVKVKCKTPEKDSYYTLDSNFTYSLITRLAQLTTPERSE